ncbi:hypothetical protein ElyMa_002128800 [Elysia marginata]|uniref:Uncharacterized protein n=1 Tax=Elysia marginata TaxID=1093978 RepID=A0AAV4FL76_9GAST|nr:hypothetical protein ElyMa_002128800 [Elysia marginata]
MCILSCPHQAEGRSSPCQDGTHPVDAEAATGACVETDNNDEGPPGTGRTDFAATGNDDGDDDDDDDDRGGVTVAQAEDADSRTVAGKNTSGKSAASSAALSVSCTADETLTGRDKDPHKTE